jgi:hypothetical protein
MLVENILKVSWAASDGFGSTSATSSAGVIEDEEMVGD